MSEYRLVMKGVVKTFPGVKALDHAQLELRPGKVMALMGENGAGKSTLMKCMFGIYKMDEGEIEYEGEKVVIANPLEALGRGIAMVHQELQPIPARTVAENIWLGRYPTKKIGPITIVDHSKMYADTDALLKKLKLQINSHAKLGSLSIAQMQMVEIAKAVSANCKVLILDEPTAGLDPRGRDLILELVKAYQQETESTVLLVSHSMEDVAKLATKVLVMNQSHLAMYGTVPEVYSRGEELVQMGLNVPQVTRIFMELKKRGFPVSDSVYTVRQGKEELLHLEGRREAAEC